MNRSSFVRWFCPLSFLFSDPVGACPVSVPDREALVDAGLSSIRDAISVAVYDREGDPYCQALLDLKLSALPSRSIVPRPREIAAEVAPVAKAYGAKNCAITVYVEDDTDTDFADDEEECYRGEFRFDGASWWAVEDDAPCW